MGEAKRRKERNSNYGKPIEEISFKDFDWDAIVSGKLILCVMRCQDEMGAGFDQFVFLLPSELEEHPFIEFCYRQAASDEVKRLAYRRWCEEGPGLFNLRDTIYARQMGEKIPTHAGEFLFNWYTYKELVNSPRMNRLWMNTNILKPVSLRLIQLCDGRSFPILFNGVPINKENDVPRHHLLFVATPDMKSTSRKVSLIENPETL